MNEEALKAGHIQQADTIEELAEKLGLPAEAIAKTVERNNQNYDNQRDDDFGKNHSGFPLYANLPSSAYVPQALCYAPWTVS